MKSRRFVCFVALAAASLLLSSCGESKNPLSDPLKAKPDAQLAGVWRASDPHDPNAVGYVHVGRAGGKLPPGIIEALSIGHNQDGTLSAPERMLMFSTSIGKSHYLNVVVTKNENSSEDIARFTDAGWKTSLIKYYCLVKYEVNGDALSVWIMDCDARGKLIDSGKIKGSADKEAYRLMFTDTSEKLAAMLAAPENANLFDKEPTFRFKRVK